MEFLHTIVMNYSLAGKIVFIGFMAGLSFGNFSLLKELIIGKVILANLKTPSLF